MRNLLFALLLLPLMASCVKDTATSDFGLFAG